MSFAWKSVITSPIAPTSSIKSKSKMSDPAPPVSVSLPVTPSIVSSAEPPMTISSPAPVNRDNCAFDIDPSTVSSNAVANRETKTVICSIFEKESVFPTALSTIDVDPITRSTSALETVISTSSVPLPPLIESLPAP